MALPTGAIPFAGTLTPTSEFDTYPITLEEYNKGGYRTVATLAERDTIPLERRKLGMLVKCLEDDKLYTLKIDLNMWEEFIIIGTVDPSIDLRLSKLENEVYEYEIYELITSGLSGTVTLPTGASIISNQYPSGGDCFISKTDQTTQRPIEEIAREISGEIINASLDINGNYVLTGTPKEYPVAIIYQIAISSINKSNLNNERILDSSLVNENPTFEGIQLRTDRNNPLHREGRLFYDNIKHSLSFYNEEPDITVNLGQEVLIRVKNETGATIPNGFVVRPVGVTLAGEILIDLANAHDREASRLVGVVTHDIPSGQSGYVTKLGEVGGLNTSIFTSGNILYLSSSPGQLTNIKPTGSNYIVRIAAIKKVDATNGSILVDINTTEFSVEASTVVGWSPSDTATFSFNDTNRTLTINANGTDFCFYQFGDKYTKTTDSIVLPDEEGLFIVYYNLGDILFLKNPNTSQIASLIRNNPLIAYIYWDATNKKCIYDGNEFHGISMSADTHVYAHFSFGARYLSGLLPTNVVEGNGSLNSHAQFGISAGAIADEDISHSSGEILPTTGLPIYYLSGTELSPSLRLEYNPGFSFLNIGTGRVAYNSLLAGNWILSESTNLDFVLCHVFACNSKTASRKVYAIVGQNNYATTALAQAGAVKEIKNLKRTGILPQETVTLATFIIQTANSYSNSVKAKIVPVDSERLYIDWTGASIGNPGSNIQTSVFSDDAFEVYDTLDINKKVKLDASKVTTGTTRTLSFPDKSGRAVVDNVESTEIVPSINGNKTLSVKRVDGVTSVLDVDTENLKVSVNGDISTKASSYQYFSQVLNQDSVNDLRLKGDGSWEICTLSNVNLGQGTWVNFSGPIVYNGTAERTVGGIAEGEIFTNYSFVEMWNKLIKEEKFPILTAPSVNFSSSITGLREVGEILNLDFNATFSRGSINPQYTALSEFRSGLPNTYIYSGAGLLTTPSSSLTDSKSISNYSVLLNGQSWSCKVAYDSGVQPKSSYDNDYDSPLLAGETLEISQTITGVYPVFATTTSITILTKQPLALHTSPYIEFTLVAEDMINKQIVELPYEWSTITGIQMYNTLSGQWDFIGGSKENSLLSFTQTDTTKDINGNLVSYRKFTHNGSVSGARQLRFITY